MKYLLVISTLFCWTNLFSQSNEILKIAFSDTSNFDITTSFNNTRPKKCFVLNRTDQWNTYRFHIDNDLTSEKVLKELQRDEHSPYNHSYIFKDTMIAKLFNESQRQYLFILSKSIQSRQLTDTFKVFRLIPSYEKAKNGFFFSVTDPIFTSDKQFAFLDITTFKKDKDTDELRFAYFGHTLLIYQNLNKKGWTRIKKIDYLIL